MELRLNYIASIGVILTKTGNTSHIEICGLLREKDNGGNKDKEYIGEFQYNGLAESVCGAQHLVTQVKYRLRFVGSIRLFFLKVY